MSALAALPPEDALTALPVTARARMMRELERLEEQAIRDKSYQRSPIGQEARLYLQTLRFEGASQNTLDSYETVYARLSVVFADFDGLAVFCEPDGVAYLRDFLDRYWGEASTETRRQRLAALRSLFKWGVGERGLPFNPAAKIKPPRSKDTLRTARLRSETLRLLDGQKSLRDRVALELVVRLGLRKNDIRLLQIRDVDLSRSAIWLRHRKGGDDIMLPFEYPTLRDDLYLHIVGESREPLEYLLYPKNERTQSMDPSSVHRWFKRCLDAADLPDFPLHELRHTAGDELWRATGNLVLAQQLLGHRSIETTRRYLHPSPEDLRAGMRVVAGTWSED